MKILLSTDIGSDIDDALALLTILNHPKIDLEAIYTVNGDVSSRAFIAKHIVNLSGQNISVARGEAESLNNSIKPYQYFEDCLVDSSFMEDNTSREIVPKPIETVGIIPNGIEDLANRLHEEHVIFNISPLTNIARLVQKYPKLTRNIQRLYVMGCRFSDEEVRLEHNIRYDSDAANLVFQSEIPITIVPSEVCDGYRMPIRFLDNINTSYGYYVLQMAKSFLGIKTSQNYGSSRFSNHLTLDSAIKHFMISSLKNMPQEEKVSIYKKETSLRTNLNDSFYAAFEQDNFFRQYHELVNHLRNPKLQYKHGEELAKILLGLIPKDISVSDVYIPYCFLNPDKITTDKINLKCTKEGGCIKIPGKKHDIVTSLDYGHFQQFIQNYLK